jgi:hypothetical protein
MKVMKKLFTFNIGGSAEAQLLKDLLDKEGNGYVMRNEQLSTALGGALHGVLSRALDSRGRGFSQGQRPARQLAESRQPVPWLMGVAHLARKMIADQFSPCWQCGKARR